MSELVYRQPCPRAMPNGMPGSCFDGLDIGSIPQGAADCKACDGKGYVEQVLDPDKVLFGLWRLDGSADSHTQVVMLQRRLADSRAAKSGTVADVLEVLDQEER